jgi:hypothetical protein
MPNLLSNDNDRGDAITAINAPSTTTQGGTLVVNGNGTFTYTPAANFSGVDTFTYTITNAIGTSVPATVTINVAEGPDASTQITGRHIFYNNSGFDLNNPGANASSDPLVRDDDTAIDPSKSAVLPGGATTTIANYTNYNKGINGIMVDIVGATKTPEISDFTFQMSITGTTNLVDAPAPSIIDIRPGEGVGGGDRVTLIWDTTAGPAIKNTWLKVTVGTTLGLAAADQFWFGNQIADATGPAANGLVQVDSNDQAAARANPGFQVGPDFLWDFDKNRNGNSGDQAIARENPSPAFSSMRMFDPPAAGGLSAGALTDEQIWGDDDDASGDEADLDAALADGWDTL